MDLRDARRCLFFLALGLLNTAASAAGPGPFPAKLAGTVANNSKDAPQFGASVSLSGDGRIALVGAPKYLGGIGAAWIFTYDGLSWQSGPGLPNGSCSQTTNLGSGVALSADGNTAIVGGYLDDCFAGLDAGAIFAYTRDARGAWSA